MFPFLIACKKNKVARNLLCATLWPSKRKGKWALHTSRSSFWGISEERSTVGAPPVFAQSGKIRSTKHCKNGVSMVSKGCLLPVYKFKSSLSFFQAQTKKIPVWVVYKATNWVFGSLHYLFPVFLVKLNKKWMSPSRRTWQKPSMRRWALWKKQHCPTWASTCRTSWATYGHQTTFSTIYRSQRQFWWWTGECLKWHQNNAFLDLYHKPHFYKSNQNPHGGQPRGEEDCWALWTSSHSAIGTVSLIFELLLWLWKVEES